MTAEILLTHSYFLHFDPKQQAAHMPYPPLGTLYAASVLRAAGRSVAFCDTLLASSEVVLRPFIDRHHPRIVVIYDDDFHYLNKMCLTRMREAAFTMTRIAKESGCRVIVHGSDAADHAELYLENGADVVVIGEGEATLNDVCSAMLEGREDAISSIAGTAVMKEGKLLRYAKRVVRTQLDELPFPAWDLVEWERYRKEWISHHGYFSVNMVTTRGCPYHCNWCAKPIYGQVYNSRSPENVVQEMELLRSLARPDHIWFADDIFGLKPGWLPEFAATLKRRGFTIPFKIQSRADLIVRPGEATALADAGCTEVWIGAESGAQKILDAMDKGITVAQIGSARTALKENGVDAAFFLQFGYRGETMAEIEETIAMVERMLPENIGISVSYPLPGTKFYDMVAAEMGEKKNWSDSDDLAMMYRGTYPPEFYRRLHRYVHRRFRRAQGRAYLKEILAFRSIPGISRLRRIVLLLYYIPMIVVDRWVLGKHLNT